MIIALDTRAPARCHRAPPLHLHLSTKRILQGFDVHCPNGTYQGMENPVCYSLVSHCHASCILRLVIMRNEQREISQGVS